jgi:hypothetical protein
VKTPLAVGEFFVAESYDVKSRNSIWETMMKKMLKSIGVLAMLGILALIVIVALLPWMDRWGATSAEIGASFPGDELVPSPRYVYNRVVTVNAAPEDIYPWLVQMGAERGGMYS